MPSATGKLADNIMHFGRLLRAAGLPVGPGHTIDALRTVSAVGVHRREDVYWALHAAFVKRRDQEELFAEAFETFWRDPYAINDALSLLLPANKVEQEEKRKQTSRRLQEAWAPPEPTRTKPREPEPEQRVDIDAVLTYSDEETLKQTDFEQMSAAEMARAKALIARMRLAHLEVKTRRFQPRAHGERLDLRRMLKASLRTGGHDIPLAFKRRRTRPPPIVALCDISGSMDRYSRIVLHFLHALTSDRDRVHSFVFGTRLTNITRRLRYRDVDQALAKVGEDVLDWAGGTRLGACLHEFNRVWSRRVLGQGAIVLLITDGLDRDPHSGLAHEAERLRKSCRRLIWLNPLLRYDGFQPRAAGVKALLPCVHEFRPVHDLQSLEQLVGALEALAT